MKMEEMTIAIDNFGSARGYRSFDFATVTFLYYTGQKNGFAEFKVIRVCDAEEYNTEEKQTETMKIDLDDLPLDLLDILEFKPKRETERRKLNNINKVILMFNEGTDEQELVVLNPATYHHTLHLAFKPEWGQLNSIQGLKNVALELLRSNYQVGTDNNENILELEKSTEYLGTFFRTCTVEQCDGFTKILSFRSNSSVVKPIDEVAENFLKIAGDEVLAYDFNDKFCQIIVRAQDVEDYNGDQPVYVLNYSDTGFCETHIASGWFNAQVYWASTQFSLKKAEWNYSKVFASAKEKLESDIEFFESQSQIPLIADPVSHASAVIVDARRNNGLKNSFPGDKLLDAVYKGLENKQFNSLFDLKRSFIEGIYGFGGLKDSNRALLETKGAKAILTA